ncbi:hypothetical protein L207DRAFT_509358 [Hyaloscypha variabilis F]|uniref:Uncharacterized protein n=1 Tax=Hyaloscypha variabilis (strain UAMH 11265 / GT02V1 / F) TaxID=1149755 RepID=A0A2J6S1K8_HYAVF|nr:hypothetical protein L207DRAFT_509358 [Hyaloscypha variabilis F]
MADTTTTLPSTPPDSNTPAPSPAAPAQVITPPPTHDDIPTTEPSTSEQPVLPDPQIAILLNATDHHPTSS